MDDSQLDMVSFSSKDGAKSPTAASAKQPSVASSDSDEASMRSSHLDMEDHEMARAIKKIEKLSAEIRANKDAEGQVRVLKERIESARKSAALTIAQLNDKMDEIEQAWDDQILAEQKSIAKEVLSILKDLKEEDLSKALSWRKKKKKNKGNRGTSTGSSRSTSASRSKSSGGSSVPSSSFSKKIAHLDKKDREFAKKAVNVTEDAKQLDAMSRNLDNINELERVVCNKLGKLQSVGDAKPGSAVYGTVELVDNYRMTVEHLANAIRSLSSVSCLPPITTDDPITKAEIDKICGSMTEFMGRIKAQLSSNGPSAENSPSRKQTSVRVAKRSSSRADAAQSEESGASYESDRAARSSSTPSSGGASTAKSIESHQG